MNLAAIFILSVPLNRVLDKIKPTLELNDKMYKLLARLFVLSAAFLLLTTAGAKVISSFGTVGILRFADPVFGIEFRHLFEIVATMEIVVAFICILSRSLTFQAVLVACLSSEFLFYRIALLLVGYQKPCNCLGTLTEAIHISEQTADVTMKFILAYLLIGSYGTLFWLWKEKSKNSILSQRARQADGHKATHVTL
jgi:hypothetical protein